MDPERLQSHGPEVSSSHQPPLTCTAGVSIVSLSAAVFTLAACTEFLM